MRTVSRTLLQTGHARKGAAGDALRGAAHDLATPGADAMSSMGRSHAELIFYSILIDNIFQYVW